MTRRLCADHLVMRGLLLAAGITGHGLSDAFGVLKHALNTPEATAREHNGFKCLGGSLFIHSRSRNDHGWLGSTRRFSGKTDQRNREHRTDTHPFAESHWSPPRNLCKSFKVDSATRANHNWPGTDSLKAHEIVS